MCNPCFLNREGGAAKLLALPKRLHPCHWPINWRDLIQVSDQHLPRGVQLHHCYTVSCFLLREKSDHKCVCVLELDEEQLSSSLKGIEDRLVEEYKNSASNKQTKSELERIVQGQDYSTRPKSRTITYSTPFCHQFNWVLKRTFKNLMLNPQTSFAQVSTTIYSRH